MDMFRVPQQASVVLWKEDTNVFYYRKASYLPQGFLSRRTHPSLPSEISVQVWEGGLELSGCLLSG